MSMKQLSLLCTLSLYHDQVLPPSCPTNYQQLWARQKPQSLQELSISEYPAHVQLCSTDSEVMIDLALVVVFQTLIPKRQITKQKFFQWNCLKLLKNGKTRIQFAETGIEFTQCLVLKNQQGDIAIEIFVVWCQWSVVAWSAKAILWIRAKVVEKGCREACLEAVSICLENILTEVDKPVSCGLWSDERSSKSQTATISPIDPQKKDSSRIRLSNYALHEWWSAVHGKMHCKAQSLLR